MQRLDACYWSSPFLFYNVWLTFLTTDYPMLITLTQTWSQSGLVRGTLEELHKIWWKMYVAPFWGNVFFSCFGLKFMTNPQRAQQYHSCSVSTAPKCHTAFLCTYFWHAAATWEHPGQTFSTSLQKHTSTVKFQDFQSRCWSQHSKQKTCEMC